MTYTQYPERTVTIDGLGAVRLAVTNGHHVAVSSVDGLTFRGQTYSAMAHFYREADGGNGWDVRDQYTSVRRNFTDAPKTYEAAILAALRGAVIDTVTDEMLADAQRADMANTLERLDADIAKAQAELDRLQAERATVASGAGW